jgi:hypothetical protein
MAYQSSFEGKGVSGFRSTWKSSFGHYDDDGETSDAEEVVEEGGEGNAAYAARAVTGKSYRRDKRSDPARDKDGEYRAASDLSPAAVLAAMKRGSLAAHPREEEAVDTRPTLMTTAAFLETLNRDNANLEHGHGHHHHKKEEEGGEEYAEQRTNEGYFKVPLSAVPTIDAINRSDDPHAALLMALLDGLRSDLEDDAERKEFDTTVSTRLSEIQAAFDEMFDDVPASELHTTYGSWESFKQQVRNFMKGKGWNTDERRRYKHERKMQKERERRRARGEEEEDMGTELGDSLSEFVDQREEVAALGALALRRVEEQGPAYARLHPLPMYAAGSEPPGLAVAIAKSNDAGGRLYAALKQFSGVMNDSITSRLSRPPENIVQKRKLISIARVLNARKALPLYGAVVPVAEWSDGQMKIAEYDVRELRTGRMEISKLFPSIRHAANPAGLYDIEGLYLEFQMKDVQGRGRDPAATVVIHPEQAPTTATRFMWTPKQTTWNAPTIMFRLSSGAEHVDYIYVVKVKDETASMKEVFASFFDFPNGLGENHELDMLTGETLSAEQVTYDRNVGRDILNLFGFGKHKPITMKIFRSGRNSHLPIQPLLEHLQEHGVHTMEDMADDFDDEFGSTFTQTVRVYNVQGRIRKEVVDISASVERYVPTRDGAFGDMRSLFIDEYQLDRVKATKSRVLHFNKPDEDSKEGDLKFMGRALELEIGKERYYVKPAISTNSLDDSVSATLWYTTGEQGSRKHKERPYIIFQFTGSEDDTDETTVSKHILARIYVVRTNTALRQKLGEHEPFPSSPVVAQKAEPSLAKSLIALVSNSLQTTQAQCNAEKAFSILAHERVSDIKLKTKRGRAGAMLASILADRNTFAQPTIRSPIYVMELKTAATSEPNVGLAKNKWSDFLDALGAASRGSPTLDSGLANELRSALLPLLKAQATVVTSLLSQLMHAALSANVNVPHGRSLVQTLWEDRADVLKSFY